MGAAEEKAMKKYKIAVFIATVLLFSVHYVIKTDLKTAMQAAGTGWKVLGIFYFIALLLPIIFESWLTEKTEKNYTWFTIWFFGLVLSFFIPNGFSL